jgi:hypothetical protein
MQYINQFESDILQIVVIPFSKKKDCDANKAITEVQVNRNNKKVHFDSVASALAGRLYKNV